MGRDPYLSGCADVLDGAWGPRYARDGHPDEIDDLAGLSGRHLDARFLVLRTRHHQGGVEMADAALARADEEKIHRLAEAIRSGQTAEVQAMGDLLADLGAG